MAMAAGLAQHSLDWVLKALQSQNATFHSISFYHDQPTSSCYQETESSININISQDTSSLSAFSHILKILAASNVSQASLRTLEFHRVSWGRDQVRDLIAVLDKHSNIKQVNFQRNNFDEQCLSDLSELLKRNATIKELVFSESGIGYSGSSLIASALMRNETLEELQIWDDSLGSKGAEELSKMIEVNSTLKLLIILDTSSITATPLISAVLARNRSMEVHVWSGEKRERSSSKVVEFVPENNALRIYKLDVSGACRVACALGWNSMVKLLDFTGVKLKSRWAREFRAVLEQNRTLKQVKLTRTCLKDKGVVYVAAGLFMNQSLECLEIDGNWFTGVGVEHLMCPLSRFSALQSQANTSMRSLTFGGGKTKIGRDGLRAILKLLETNQSLTYLGIHDDEGLRPYDFISIFRSMERNATLKCISLMGCRGVAGEKVLEAVMNTLQVNPWIEEIELERTPLQSEGKTEKIYMKLGQNGRSDQTEADVLKDMPLTTPQSCRVFLCGQEFAGKTTISNAICQNFSSFKLPYLNQIRTLVNPVEQAVRTEGMKIKTIQEEGIKITIWNLAGQQEYFALHDLMFPGHGSPSFFFIITSLFRKPDNKQPKSPEEVEEDLLYWLRFIVSNSRRAKMQSLLPNITLVLTHFDKVTNNTSESLQPIINSIQIVKERFGGFVEFYHTMFTVDARSSGSVSKLAHHLRKMSRTVVQRVPPIYQVCNDLMAILSDWRAENQNKPAIRWMDFCDLCQTKVPTLKVKSRYDNIQKVEKRRRAVASTLHRVGELIYFDGLEFLILDSDWFFGDVVGELMKFSTKRSDPTDKIGFISRKELEKLLKKSLQSKLIPGMGHKTHENLTEGDLIKIMLILELCYEQEPGNPNSSMLIPAILEEGRGKSQKWPLSAANCVYVGRHLECHDSSHMFLTPGFFPRLQVHLYNKIVGPRHGASYQLEKYLISITINGIFVRIELGGQMDHYVDVLACSTQTTAEMLRLYQQLLLPAIQGLCHGNTLAERIIRPECVKNLTPPRYRRTQNVSLQHLKEALLTVSADRMYDFQHSWSAVTEGGRHILPSGFNLARDLLSDDDFREVLHRRYNDLYNLAVELEVPMNDNSSQATENQSDSNIEPSLEGIAKGVEAVLQRLKIIEMDIKDLKQEIQGLRYYEHRLLIELHRKVNYLVNYSVQVDERKVPNMFYFVQTENYTRRLVTHIISGMMALRLHMLCEFRREMHVVEGQIGCELMKVDNTTVRCLVPYMSKFMKLLTFALKIGAQFAAGMGHLIPDLSREVAHFANSGFGYGVAAMGAGAIGAALVGNRSSRDTQQDFRGAHQWLLDFLRSQNCLDGKEIAERFGLWRVRYRDDGQVAWICKKHLEVRAYEVIEVPV